MSWQRGLAAIALLVGCGDSASDDDTSNDFDAVGPKGFLGSYLTPDPAGGVAECTNYYSDRVSAAQKEAIQKVLNRKEVCPVMDAIGSCVFPTSASGGLGTQNEMVYYQGKDQDGDLIDASEYTTRKDGEPCEGQGLWKTKYDATRPKEVAGGKVPAPGMNSEFTYFSCYTPSKNLPSCEEVTLRGNPDDYASDFIGDAMTDCNRSHPDRVLSTEPDSCPRDLTPWAICEYCVSVLCFKNTLYKSTTIKDDDLASLWKPYQMSCINDAHGAFTIL